MKNVLVLTESLIGCAFSALMSLVSVSKDNHYQFFKFAREKAEIAGVLSNYNTLIDKLRSNGITYEFLKEDGLDEYLYANKEKKEIYLTPTSSDAQVISSAAVMGYRGDVYIYGKDFTEPEIENYKADIDAFYKKGNIGTKGLDNSDARYSHVAGSKCTFTIDGKKYTEIIKSRSSTKHMGVEGFTQLCESDKRYRLKIWDIDKKRYEVDKVDLMTRYPYKNHQIGLPLSMVYNDHNNPIGFVMNNFRGEDFNVDKLHLMDKPLVYVKQILEQLIWLESHGFLHRDINHNIIVDTDKKAAHIIDLDSIQFRHIPASAFSSDPCNALPVNYECDSHFFNTIDLAYTGITLLAAAFVSTDKLFGDWSKSSGFCELRSGTFRKIEMAAPEIASLVREAHTTGRPVSLVRQLKAVNNVLSAGKTVIREPHNKPSDTVDEYNGDTSSELGDNDDIFKVDKPVGNDDDNRGDIPVTDDNKCDIPVTDHSDDSVFGGNGFRRQTKTTPTKPRREHQTINVENANQKKASNGKASLLLKKWILKLFLSDTSVVGSDTETLWNTFISTGKWKAPLFGTLTVIFTIIALIIAIIKL